MHTSFEKLREMLADGERVTVEFLPEIEDMETYAEKGMRAVLTSCRKTDQDDVMRLTFDFGDFNVRNAALESANYYGTDGIPNKTARESGFFDPTDPIETIYFDTDRDPLAYFKLIA